MLIIGFVHRTCQRNGLAEAHFRWSKSSQDFL
jgi:hypothetical protein